MAAVAVETPVTASKEKAEDSAGGGGGVEGAGGC